MIFTILAGVLSAIAVIRLAERASMIEAGPRDCVMPLKWRKIVVNMTLFIQRAGHSSPVQVYAYWNKIVEIYETL